MQEEKVIMFKSRWYGKTFSSVMNAIMEAKKGKIVWLEYYNIIIIDKNKYDDIIKGKEK